MGPEPSWAGIEYQMTEILAYTTEIQGWLAAELLNKIRKMTLKRRFVIDAVGKMYGDFSKQVAERCFDLKVLPDLQTERDRLAHGVFIIPNESEDPDMVIRSEGYGDSVEWYGYTHAILDAMIAQFDSAEMKVTHLWLMMMTHASAREFWKQVVTANPPISEEALAELLGVPGMKIGSLHPTKGNEGS